MKYKNVKVSLLQTSDFNRVQEMDGMSGFDVSQWVLDAIDDGKEECSSTYGIKLGDELIGYCSIGYAGGALCIDVDDVDSRLLSDVFILPEYRHNGYGSMLINEVIKLESDCTDYDLYLTYIYDELQDFYENFGFIHVKGTNNIMVRKAIN